jgi:hypothetical protein
MICMSETDMSSCLSGLSKRAEGKSSKESLRCLKRRLSDAVPRCLLADAVRQGEARPQ